MWKKSSQEQSKEEINLYLSDNEDFDAEAMEDQGTYDGHWHDLVTHNNRKV